MAGSRWIKLDVDYFGNPKVLTAGHPGATLHVAAICWAGRYLTDGDIPLDAVPIIAHDAGVEPRVTEQTLTRLVGAGLWIPTDTGFVLHDFAAMNLSRAEVERARKATRERVARWRERSRDVDEY